MALLTEVALGTPSSQNPYYQRFPARTFVVLKSLRLALVVTAEPLINRTPQKQKAYLVRVSLILNAQPLSSLPPRPPRHISPRDVPKNSGEQNIARNLNRGSLMASRRRCTRMGILHPQQREEPGSRLSDPPPAHKETDSQEASRELKAETGAPKVGRAARCHAPPAWQCGHPMPSGLPFTMIPGNTR